MGVRVLSEVVTDELAGIIVWSEKRQDWVAAISPALPRPRQQLTCRNLADSAGEDCPDMAFAS